MDPVATSADAARSGNCLDPDAARAFALGKLASDRVVGVEQHMDRCAECRWLISELARALASRVSDATTLMAESAPGSAAPVHVQGDTIGRYVVQSVLGRGGMGVVYSAYDPELDRRVALKLLRPERFSGDGTEQARARLLREAQAMARVAHPNVVTVHDVGTHGAELYVAMELIDGMTLGTWLREEPRPRPAAIVAAFVEAGRGLAQAHAAGLIHRDFKPDNVLRGKDGRICVTDFGLARSVSLVDHIDGSVDDASVADARMTRPGSLLGTPLYMAPEQLLGDAADARTDQFSFCVALYEALYHQHPFGGRTIGELAELVLAGKVRPPPAGTRVPDRIRRVVARGMAVKPEDRFATMDGLLAELVRDTARAWRRGIAATVLAGGAVAGWLAFGFKDTTPTCSGAERSWERVVAELPQARDAFLATKLPYAATAWAGVERSLERYRRSWIAMHHDACEATRVRGEQSEALLDRRMECLNRRLAGVTALTTLLAHADAQVVEKSRLLVDELVPVTACADTESLSAAVAPPEPGQRAGVETIRAGLAYAKTLEAAGKLKEAMEIARPLAATARALGYRPLEAEAVFRTGSLQLALGDPKAAEKTYYDALWAAEASRSDELAAEVWTALVDVVGARQGRVEEGVRLIDRASAALERVGHPAALEIALLSSTARVHNKQANYAEAVASLEQALALAKNVYGADDARTSRVESQLATALQNLERYADAKARFEHVKEMQHMLLGPEHPDVASTLEHLATMAVAMGQFDQALADYRQALAIAETALGELHPQVSIILGGMGQAYFAQGKFAEALPYLERAATITEKTLGPDNPTTARQLGNYALALASLDKRDEARVIQERVLAIKEKNLGPNHPAVAATLINLGELVQASGAFEQALAYHQRALAIYEAKLGKGKTNPPMGSALANTGFVLTRLGRFREAIAPLQRALPIMEADKAQPPGSVTELRALLALAKRCAESPRGTGCRTAALARR